MLFSPFKKKNYKKKKRNLFNITPPSSKNELRDALLRTYSSKAKNPSKLPILMWMNNYKNLEENWMRDLLGQDTDSASTLVPPLCLIYCFFIGRTDNVFESSVGRSGQKEHCKMKCIRFLNEEFQEQFTACIRLVDNNKRKKFCITDKMFAKFLSSIEECSNFVWSPKNTVCPLEAFLAGQNSTSGPGWLRILLFHHESRELRQYTDRCKLVVILHTIIRGFCGNTGTLLCFALGKKGSRKNDIQWLKLIAKDLVWNILPPQSPSDSARKPSPGLKSSATAPTALASNDLSTSIQDSILSPSIVPVSVSFADEKEDNRTSPLTVDDLTSSADTPLVVVVDTVGKLQSTPSNSKQRFETSSPPTFLQQSPSSLQSTPETPGMQVKKRVCLAPTPVLSPFLRRALFIPAVFHHPQHHRKTPEQTNRISPEISQECRHFMDAISTCQNDEDVEKRALEFVSLRADHDGNLLDKRIYPLPSRSVGATTRGKSRKKYVLHASRSVIDFIKSTVSGAASDEDLQKAVLAKAIESNFDVTVSNEPEGEISSLEVLEIRNRSGWNVSTSVITSITKDFLTLLKKKKMLVSDKKVFEGQLRKKIGLLERVSAVPSKFEYVECHVTKEDVERCVYYYIENVPLLIERLVSSCIMEGEMEDSLAFSTYENKAIFRFGADRGGGDLIMMIALANRCKGNHGLYSIPIGVVEGATETYSNLEKTVYSSTRKAILEQLVNQQLFMIRIQFFLEDDRSAAPQDVKCILLRLIGVKRQELSLMRIVCTIGGIEYVGIPHTQMPQWKSRADGRVTADDASINKDLLFVKDNGKQELRLNLRLVQFEDHYIGCRVQIATTMEEIFSFKFDNGVNTKDIDLNNSMADCLQLIGVPCEDGKMCTTVYGLSTCGSSYPCPKCHWPLREGVAPTWVGDYTTEDESSTNSNAIAVPTKDYRGRTGKYSRNESYYHYTALIGQITGDPPLRLKKQVYSVIHKPLLHIEDDLLYLHTGDPMHVSQGLMTHLTEETVVQLQKATELGLESQPDFVKDQTTKAKAFVEVMASRASSFAFKHAQNRFKQEDTLVKSAFKELRAADDEAVDECYEAYTSAVMKRDEVGQELGYYETSRKLNGADELRSLLNALERSKKKNFTKTVYLFMKAIKTFSGDFNKNHGQYELTNARGIKTLQHNEEVYNIVINGSNDDPAVLEIMNWWQSSAKLLLQISIALKSQDKQGIEDILKLKENIANFVQRWVNRLVTYERKNPVYWKMHMLLCSLIPFIVKTGMSGRCSTEGFENKHHVMNHLKRLMAPIAQDKLRCEKLSQRQQSCLIPGVDEVHCLFEEEDYRRRRGPRGRYSSFGTRTKLIEDLPVADEPRIMEADDEAVEGYFVSQKSNLIPNELRDIYYYMLLGKVPDAWSQNFIDSALLGSKASNSARYIPP